MQDIEIGTPLITIKDCFTHSVGTRAVVMSADSDPCIMFIHPHIWEKNTFARIPVEALKFYFKNAKSEKTSVLDGWNIQDLQVDRRDHFRFTLSAKDKAIAECKSNGYSTVLFQPKYDTMYPSQIEYALNLLYDDCVSYAAGETEQEKRHEIQLELALYFRLALHLGTLRFKEYFKLKKGAYHHFSVQASA